MRFVVIVTTATKAWVGWWGEDGAVLVATTTTIGAGGWQAAA
jgi:hypothetical protein